MNPVAIIIINLAFIFYTIGVWSEKISGKLKYKHLIFFFLGLICDTLGTSMMFKYSRGFSFSFHGISGVIAIILMIIHAFWALYILVKNNEKMILTFHKYSIMVWIIWLIPFSTPMILNIIK